MMNEVGNYPGQPWMWLYTFWYQVKPFSTSDNADVEVWALMMLLTLLLMFVPFIPGLRSIPRWIPIHRLVWREYYSTNRKLWRGGRRSSGESCTSEGGDVASSSRHSDASGDASGHEGGLRCVDAAVGR